MELKIVNVFLELTTFFKYCLKIATWVQALENYQFSIEAGKNQTLQDYLNPLDIGRILITKEDRKICGVVIEALKEEGALRKLFDIAEKFGIVIRYVQFSMPNFDDTTTRGLAFIDFTNSTMQPKEILKILRKQNFVKKAEIVEPSKSLKGIIYDAFFFPLEIKKRKSNYSKRIDL